MVNRKCYEELTDQELIEEIDWRRSQCQRTPCMVCATDHTIHRDVIKVCHEILEERGVEIQK